MKVMKNETTLKQWHDDDLVKFHKEFKLTFGQCDINNKLTLAELLLMTSDTAVEDYNQKGLSWQYLVDNGVTILTSRSAFHIEKMPVANQKITLNTWEEKSEGLQLSRKYEIIDSESSELLIKGWSFWTVVDFQKRKIIPPKIFTLRPEPTVSTDYDGVKPGKISLPETMKEIGSHKIVFSDMDANGHTNNSKYINFVLDSLPAEYQNKTYKDFKINYSKEAVLNDEVCVQAEFASTENKIIIAGKNKGESCFECELYF